jgi:RNA polymerase sigma-70 factor (ECF subfamily)
VIEVELHPIDPPEPSDLAATVADRELLATALGRLDAGQRAVIVLHYFLGLPMPEVAASLGIPLGTSQSRLHAALAAMRVIVVDDGQASSPELVGGQRA